MSKIKTLVLTAQRVEDKLPLSAKLKLAKKRFLRKVANEANPEAYGKESHVQKDNSESSSKQLEDDEFEKNQESVLNEESDVK